MSALIIRLQKTDCRKETDDVIYAYKTDDGSIDVIVKSYTNPTNTYYSFHVQDFYYYLDTLYDIFVADTANEEGSEMCSIQADIPGFPSFMLMKETFYDGVDALNAAIEFWVSA